MTAAEREGKTEYTTTTRAYSEAMKQRHATAEKELYAHANLMEQIEHKILQLDRPPTEIESEITEMIDKFWTELGWR